MKNIFAQWENKPDDALRSCIEKWLHQRTKGFSAEESERVYPLFISELAVRTLEDAPNLAPAVLDAIFNSRMLYKNAISFNAVVNRIIDRCSADDSWNVLPSILKAIHPRISSIPSLNDPCVALAQCLMKGPSDFSYISQHFDETSKTLMLPYCVACDPYNTKFISEQWGMTVASYDVWLGLVIHTQGFKKFDETKHLQKLGEQITLSQMLEHINTPIELREIKALSTVLKSLQQNNMPNFADYSWEWRNNPTPLYQKWHTILSIATPHATPTDQVILEKLHGITQQFDVSFTDMLSQFQKSVLTEAIDTDNLIHRAPRKI